MNELPKSDLVKKQAGRKSTLSSAMRHQVTASHPRIPSKVSQGSRPGNPRPQGEAAAVGEISPATLKSAAAIQVSVRYSTPPLPTPLREELSASTLPHNYSIDFDGLGEHTNNHQIHRLTSPTDIPCKGYGYNAEYVI